MLTEDPDSTGRIRKGEKQNKTTRIEEKAKKVDT